jgi:hypothetical protein
VHDVWVSDGDVQRDASAHAVAEDIGRFKPQLLDRGRDVIRHPFKRQWAFDISGAAVGLHLEGNDLTGLGKLGQKLPNEVPMAENAPCSNTSGCPLPWIS